MRLMVFLLASVGLAQTPYDVILRHGTVIDGTGAKAYKADVAIRGGYIAEIGNLAARKAAIEIDATGLYVAPGFINIHSHAVPAALSSAVNMLTQGVTTEILNPDGGGSTDVAKQLSSVAEPAVNIGAFIGFNAVWASVVGPNDRRPNAEEISQMRALVERNLQAGAFGVSAGLDYKPGYFAKTGEVIEVVSVAKAWRTNFPNHERVGPESGYSSRVGIAETLEIGRKAGLMPVITHMKVQGHEQGTAGKVIALMGRDAAADAYPYLAGQTGLGALTVPAWAQDGGRPEMLKRFQNPEQRARIAKEIEEALNARFGGAEGVYLPQTQQQLVDVMRAHNAPAGETVIQLLEQGSPPAILKFGKEEDLVKILQHPTTAIACDCGATLETRIHPRTYGTFPRVLGHYVRETHALTWEDAVRKMTGLPASTVGLVDRGFLVPGMMADVTVFDPATVIDHATYENPAQLSEGIRFVLVNGKLALRDGKATGEHAGRALARTNHMPSRPMRLAAKRPFSWSGNGMTIKSTTVGLVQTADRWTAITGRARVLPGGEERAFTAILDGSETVVEVEGQGEWAFYGHDPSGTRFSPLAQITPANVGQLQRAWTYHTGEKGRTFESTPIVVNGVMYVTTSAQRVVALDPVSGKELWTYDPHSSPKDHRGVSYWPGDTETPARIVFGTGDGRLIALQARTGEPVLTVDLRAGVADHFPDANYAISSPPAIYKDLVIVGPSTQEGPSRGPSGDVRAFDVKTGKMVWRFHTIREDTWGPDGGKDRSGPSAWGFVTVDQERGMIFVPVGNPADSFYGADRKGTNLYSDSVVALDAATGKLRWYYQLVHHDLFDYDVAAAPALVEVKRDGKTIPAVAQITKMGLLFILDRMTGKPVFGVEERPVAKSDVLGEESWPTQPFPVKPPPLSRMTMTRDDITDRTPDAAKFCGEWFDRLVNLGPYTPIGTKPGLRFPGTMGGGNWGGVSFDPGAGLIFVNTSSLGGTGQMVPARAGAPMPYRNEGAYVRFVDKDGFPCQRPPWGELSAVNANTGDVVWRVPLPTINMSGSIATGGGLVFLGATLDARLRAFDSRTGKVLWTGELGASADATPITYLGRDGKQYVVIAAGGPGRFRGLGNAPDDAGDALVAFALK